MKVSELGSNIIEDKKLFEYSEKTKELLKDLDEDLLIQ